MVRKAISLVLLGCCLSVVAAQTYLSFRRNTEQSYEEQVAAIASLYAWWQSGTGVEDAATGDPAGDGDDVDAWRGHSGTGHDLEQSTAADQPTYSTNQLNGEDTINFDGVNHFLQITGGFGETLAQPWTIYIVCAQDAWTSNDAVFDGDDSTNRSMLWSWPTSAYDMTQWAGSIGANVDPGDTSYHAYRLMFDGVSSEISYDGNPPSSGDAGSKDIDGFTLGASFSGAVPADVHVAEVIIFDVELTGDDHTTVMNYLNDRFFP